MSDSKNLQYLRQTFRLAEEAMNHGNHPFGALLVDAEGAVVAEAENTTQTERDCSGHAELNLVRNAGKLYEPGYLAECTLYSSAEPCVMCAGAIVWSGVGKVVFGLGVDRFNEKMQTVHPDWVVRISCRAVFEKASRSIEVTGPLLEEEAEQIYTRSFHS